MSRTGLRRIDLPCNPRAGTFEVKCMVSATQIGLSHGACHAFSSTSCSISSRDVRRESCGDASCEPRRIAISSPPDWLGGVPRPITTRLSAEAPFGRRFSGLIPYLLNVSRMASRGSALPEGSCPCPIASVMAVLLMIERSAKGRRPKGRCFRGAGDDLGFSLRLKVQ